MRGTNHMIIQSFRFKPNIMEQIFIFSRDLGIKRHYELIESLWMCICAFFSIE